LKHVVEQRSLNEVLFVASLGFDLSHSKRRQAKVKYAEGGVELQERQTDDLKNLRMSMLRKPYDLKR